MRLTDQELWHILQVELPGPAKPWEKESRHGLDQEAVEWAKREVLSGCKDTGRDYNRCIVYLARLVRLLDVMAEHGIEPSRRRLNGGGSVYEESYVGELLMNGLEACGCTVEKIEEVVWYATHEGLLSEHDFDDWRPGMASGSGWRKYYGLTFKGKKHAEKASLVAAVSDDRNDGTNQDGNAGKINAEGPEEDEEPQPESVVETRPSIADKDPEMSAEEWQTAGLGLLMLFAQTYYKLLESAISMATWCTAVDLDLNGYYLWTVKHIKNLLENHEDMKDFPMKFEPLFSDLLPASISDVNWQDMVSPDAERFLSTVQKYTMEKGFQEPEEGSHAWGFVEMFRPAINLALESGNAYRKKMEENCRKNLKGQPSIHTSAAQEAKANASAAGQTEAQQADEKSKTPAIRSVEEVLLLCREKPNEAFLSWKALEQEVVQCATGEVDRQCKDRATLGAFRGWFEECGHWRDLKPSAEDFDPTDGLLHVQHKKQMEDFVAVRRARLQFIDYDEVHADHTDRSEGKEGAAIEYKWTYFLAGQPQLVLTCEVKQAQWDAARIHYMRKARPYGYAYSEAVDIGRTCTEGCAYFHDTYVEFVEGLTGDIYPPKRCQPGDYELRDVGKSGTSLEFMCGKNGSIYSEDRIVGGDYELRRVGEMGKSHTAGVNHGVNTMDAGGELNSRTFSIWEGRIDDRGRVDLAYCGIEGTQTEYKGIYFEDYEVDATVKQTGSTQKKEFRIGHIYDAVKAKLLVFRQHVTTRQDAIANAIVIGENDFDVMGILEASSCDDKPCRVEDYSVRVPTPEDMQRVNGIRRQATKGAAKHFQELIAAQRQRLAEKSVGKAPSKTPNKPDTLPNNEPTTMNPSTREPDAQQSTKADGATSQENTRTRRSPFCGDTSYIGVPLAHIVNDLSEWEQSTEQCCAFLQKKREELQTAKNEVAQETYDRKFEKEMHEWERKVSENSLSPSIIEETKPFLPKYSDVEGFIDTMTNYYGRCVLEFRRLVKELPRGVKESHATALRHILQRHDSLNDRCREFRTDYTQFGPWAELADEIYLEVNATQGDLLDLGNVAIRLGALVGTTVEMEDTVSDPAISKNDLAKHTALIIEKVEAQPMKTAALLRGTIKQKLGSLGTVVEDDFTASAHFTNLTWQNNQYVLRQTAAVIIETLYIAQKSFGLPGMQQDEVFGQVYGPNKKDWPSGKTRIQNFFRNGDAKRLWDDGCIGHDGKGNFHLNVKIHT